jgi:hypothetical protein
MEVDLLFETVYILLIFAYAQRVQSRVGEVVALLGYIVLLLGRLRKDEKEKKTLQQLGYIILIFSPSFERWYDLLGSLGYLLAALHYEGSFFIGLYEILGAGRATNSSYFVARSLYGVLEAISDP